MKNGRIDDNQHEIKKTFEQLGCSVKSVGHLGLPFDLLVGKCGMNLLIEVKDGNKPPSKRKLTACEQSFSNKWRGQYAVIKSADEALEMHKRLFQPYDQMIKTMMGRCE